MNTPDRLPPDDPATDLERRLLGWKPAPMTASPGRDRMIFEAGVALGQRRASIQAAGLAAVLLLGAGGWIITERAERVHLESALAERSADLDRALATRRIPRLPDPGPIESAPLSYAALSHPLGDPDFTLPDPVIASPLPQRSIGPADPVLTPLSGRHDAELADL